MSPRRDDAEYRRVLDALRTAILDGTYGEGARLPTVRDLTVTYGVSHGTAAKAVRELQAEGHVIARARGGVVVRRFHPIRRSSPTRLARTRWESGQPIQDADTDHRPRAVDVEVGEIPAPDWVAQPLGIEPATPVVFRSRRIVVNDRAVQVATSYIPTGLARGTAIMHTDTGPGGLYARLADQGHAPVEFVEYLRARMPLPDEVRRLHLPSGTPVIEITRHAVEDGGQCVEVNRMVLDGSAYLLDYSFSAS